LLGQSGLTFIYVSGVTSCSASLWKSDSSLTCKSSSGVGGKCALLVTNTQYDVASVSHAVSYDEPSYFGFVQRCNFPLHRESSKEGMLVRVSINYADFLASYSPALRVAGTSCHESLWTSDSLITCRLLAAAPGRKLPTSFSMASQVASLTNAFSIDNPQLSGSGTGANGPSIRKDMTIMLGIDLGVVPSSPRLKLRISACAATEWFSDTSLACKLSSGFPGRQMAVVVTISGETSTFSEAISYDSPKIRRVGAQIAMLGGNAVFLHGSDMAKNDFSLRVDIGVYGCKSTVWVADTSLRCSLYPGFTSTDLTVQALRQAVLCLTCPEHETLVRCGPASPGQCVKCSSCPSRFFRDCYSGYTSSLRCQPCQNENMPHDQRYFKPDVGSNDTACTRCKVCRRDKEFEIQRCTTTSDTRCNSCESCATGVRLGCGGKSKGRCEVIGSGNLAV